MQNEFWLVTIELKEGTNILQCFFSCCNVISLYYNVGFAEGHLCIYCQGFSMRLSLKYIACVFTETVVSVCPLIVVMYKNGSPETIARDGDRHICFY
jgi:hypothetical protein